MREVRRRATRRTDDQGLARTDRPSWAAIGYGTVRDVVDDENIRMHLDVARGWAGVALRRIEAARGLYRVRPLTVEASEVRAEAMSALLAVHLALAHVREALAGGGIRSEPVPVPELDHLFERTTRFRDAVMHLDDKVRFGGMLNFSPTGIDMWAPGGHPTARPEVRQPQFTELTWDDAATAASAVREWASKVLEAERT